MSKKKFDLIKNKKKVYIGAVGVALLAGVGVSIGYMSNGVSNDNNTSVVDKVVDKDKTDNKEESNDEKDNLVSDNGSVEVAPEENATAGSNSSSTNNESASEDKGNSTEGGTSNSGTSTENKPSTDNSSSSNSNSGGSSSNTGSGSTNNKPSSGGSSNSNNNKPSNGGSSNTGGTSKPDTHTHNWVAITEQVHHDEEGHWEEYVVSQAWTEEVPVYEYQEREICNGCGADITSDPYTHNENHMLNGEAGGWTTQWVQVQVGTNKINHPAVTDKKWIVDKAAWTETITTGYKCSSCGATK